MPAVAERPPRLALAFSNPPNPTGLPLMIGTYLELPLFPKTAVVVGFLKNLNGNER
jgi:hypothetical protein